MLTLILIVLAVLLILSVAIGVTYLTRGNPAATHVYYLSVFLDGIVSLFSALNE